MVQCLFDIRILQIVMCRIVKREVKWSGCLLEKRLVILRHLAEILHSKDDMSDSKGRLATEISSRIMIAKRKLLDQLLLECMDVNRLWKNSQNLDDQWSKKHNLHYYSQTHSILVQY